MKRLFALCFLLFALFPNVDANAATARPAVVTKQILPPTAIHGITTDTSTTQPIVAPQPRPVPAEDRGPDMREAEREACMRNNMGMGNTFVWASKYSNTTNYATMVEDVENPQNNVCFVKVEIKSADAKISVADIAPRYFEMGNNIVCGSWVDADMMRKRILDARRSGRTWGTVAGAVGGAGVGVGVMELFGNRLLGDQFIGQRALTGNALLKSRLLTAAEKDDTVYSEFKSKLAELEQECNDWPDAQINKRPKVCEEYSSLFGAI